MANTPVGKFWLLTPWLIIAIGIPTLLWWAFEPVPIEITYVAPHFLSRPAYSREDAGKQYVTEARGGGVLWRYIEYCVRRPFDATSHRAWVSKSLVWSAPDLPTMLSRKPGCDAANIAVDVPLSSPSRTFMFVQRLSITMNPIRDEVIEYAPITLTILDGK
jgi:hypothetical protein